MNVVDRGNYARESVGEGVVLNRSRSHWWNTSAPYVPQEPLAGDIEVDVCIIGGGINGISSAYHLRKLDASVRVALLEAETVGFGASGRNAGQIIMKLGGTTVEKLYGKFGAERAGAAWDYVHRGMRLIAALKEEEGIDCDYAQTGTLHVSLRDDGNRHLEDSLRLIEKMGQGRYVSWVEEAQVEKELKSPYLGAALHESRGGQFNPLKLVLGLRQAALRHGAMIFENSPAASIDSDPGAITVHTGMGSVRCRKLILTTNAFTHLVGGVKDIGLLREQTPLIVKGIVTEPISDEMWERAGWPRRCGVNVQSQLFYSFAPTVDRRLVYVGGYYTSAPWDRNITAEVEWRLREEGPEHLEAFFPALKGVRTAQTWGGAISITPDYIPHVGHARDPRVLYACGCWGNGMPVGTQNGLTLAELALDRTTENTLTWFVQRRKQQWPSRALAGVLATGVILRRRRGNRKKAKLLSPPLRFLG